MHKDIYSWLYTNISQYIPKIWLLWIFTIIIFFQSAQANEAPELPLLGDAASGTISPEKEYRLGRAWLKSLRHQMPILYDPLINEYVEHLLYKLAEHSELQDHRLELVIVKNQTLNAFAVPGGIVGINAGLFINANTEAEFASVISHELAHLSQRHYARNVEAAQRNKVPSMAALLASIIIAATAGADTGMAVIATSQAAILQKQLRFSRQNEQEADRIGIRTLVKAGMNPNAMASMFEQMLMKQRLLGARPPEFLLTHPITESRIADSKNRASQYKIIKPQVHNVEYYLMRNRVILQFSKSAQYAIKHFQNQLNHLDPIQAEAAKYGLALAYNKAHKHQQARSTIMSLLNLKPNNITYIVSYAEINQNPEELKPTEQLLRKHLVLNPNNFPISMLLAKNLRLQQRYHQSNMILKELSHKHLQNPKIWYELAETLGLEGDIIGVHQARAEYFILTGAIKKAEEQLKYARKKAGNNYQMTSILDQRVKELHRYQKDLKEL